jgi:hypothetical protein
VSVVDFVERRARKEEEVVEVCAPRAVEIEASIRTFVSSVALK